MALSIRDRTYLAKLFFDKVRPIASSRPDLTLQ